MAMVPHERSLVTHMQGKPFALLGVNCDGDTSGLKAAISQHGINWRSWVETPENELSARWQVRFFPTLIFIDAQGIVRRRIEGKPSSEEVIDREVEALVREAEGQSPRPSS